MYTFNYCATLQLVAIGTGRKVFRYGTIADFAICTMIKVNAGFSTPGTVNHFRGNVGLELNRPLFGCPGTQHIIIRHCGYSCIASSTI